MFWVSYDLDWVRTNHTSLRHMLVDFGKRTLHYIPRQALANQMINWNLKRAVSKRNRNYGWLAQKSVSWSSTLQPNATLTPGHDEKTFKIMWIEQSVKGLSWFKR